MSGLLAIPDIMEPDLGSPETTDGDGGHRDRWQIQVKHYTRPTHSLAANLNAAANIYAAAPRRRTLGNATDGTRTVLSDGRHDPSCPARLCHANPIDGFSDRATTNLRGLTGLTEGTGLSDRSDLSRRPRTSSAARPISAGGQYELGAMLRRPMSAVRPMPPRPSTASRQQEGWPTRWHSSGTRRSDRSHRAPSRRWCARGRTDSDRGWRSELDARQACKSASHHGVEWLSA